MRLPLTGLAPLLMCSASMGAEGSVTLQLREAVQAPVNESSAKTNNVATNYSDSDVFQTSGTDTGYEHGSRTQNVTNPFFKANGITNKTINKSETGMLKNI